MKIERIETESYYRLEITEAEAQYLEHVCENANDDWIEGDDDVNAIGSQVFSSLLNRDDR